MILAPVAGVDAPGLAARLLGHFGTISGIVSARDSELRRLLRIDDRWIEFVLVARNMVIASQRECIGRAKLDPADPCLRNYLASKLRAHHKEIMIGLFADASGGFIAEEVLATGGSDRINLSLRHVFARALALDCRQIVLAHNHPSGRATPSLMDVSCTEAFVRQASALEITVLDHLIVGGRDVVSMKEVGLM